MRATLPLVTALALFAGCVANDTPVEARAASVSKSDRQALASAISYNLKDPSSAQFRDWRGYALSNGDRVVCVQMNAKNGLGGYVGFKQMYVRLRGADVIAMRDVDTGADLACRDVSQNKLMIASALTAQ